MQGEEAWPYLCGSAGGASVWCGWERCGRTDCRCSSVREHERPYAAAATTASGIAFRKAGRRQPRLDLHTHHKHRTGTLSFVQSPVLQSTTLAFTFNVPEINTVAVSFILSNRLLAVCSCLSFGFSHTVFKNTSATTRTKTVANKRIAQTR